MQTPILQTTARQPDGYAVSVVDVAFPDGPVSAGEIYTVDVTLRIDQVPGVLNQDHCQEFTNGGAWVRVVVTDSVGESVTNTACVAGPPGNETTVSVDVTAPAVDAANLTPTVEFIGGDSVTGSGAVLADPVEGQIENGGGEKDDDDGSGIITRPPEYIELGEARFQSVVNPGSDTRFDIDIVSNWDAVDGPFAPGTHPDYCAAGTFNIRPGGNVTAEVSIVGWASDSSSVCVSSAEDITQIQTQLTAPTTPGTYDVEVALKGTVSGETYGTREFPSSLTIPEEEDPDLPDPGDDPDPGEDDPSDIVEGVTDFLDNQFGDLVPGVGGTATALGGLFLLLLLLAVISNVTSSVADAVNPVS